ncbi:alpha/beta hydrolase [Listeria valentina]|uniref:alpha/beta hydrolase n=1 Tax=Listeria valentina TaxID=2705293 RepID=UPI001431C8F6|nr:alpha/beta hydrolase family protein [Listeria valentina]
MAIIDFQFLSNTLATTTSISILLPEQEDWWSGGNKTTYPTLYLLHGLSNNHTTYVRNTNIERYATEKGVAVVIPSFDHSFYSNMAYGHRYFDYFTKELLPLLPTLFPLAQEREKTFVAGHSMGGYGAFKMALSCPDRFSKAASMSGVMDIDYILHHPFDNFSVEAITGGKKTLHGTPSDLYHLIRKNKKSQIELPELYQTCGTEDFLYEDNLAFRDFLQSENIQSTYTEAPGEHDFKFWDKSIQNVLEWL